MAAYKNTITFQGGINTDDDLTILPNGDYPDAFYSRNAGGVQGASGQLQSVTGNDIVNIKALPDGDNTVIGTCQYTEQNSLIYFVYNSLNNHGIYMVDNETGSIGTIAQSSVLNFKLDNKIVHCFVLDNKLYYTDGYFGSYLSNNWNGPRRIDIPWASGGGVITREAIAWDIYQPWRSPLAEYATNNEVPANYLVGKLFQFRYQWIYRTGEESVWSPISKMPISENAYFVEGIRSISTIVDNVIDVGIYTGSENVSDLRVAYREGNAGEFRVFKEMNKQDLGIDNDVEYTVQFSKDEFIYTLPMDLKNNELFPRVAQCVELLPTNEAAFANVRQGYNKELPDVKLTARYEEQIEVNGLLSSFSLKNDVGVGFNIDLRGSNLYVPVNFPYCIGDVLIFQVYESTSDNNPTIPLKFTVAINYSQATSVLRYEALRDDIIDFFTAEGITATASGSYAINVEDYYTRQANNGPSSTRSFVQCLHPVTPKKSFKTGALHQFAIQYYDNAQKDGTVWRGDVSSFRVPTIPELKELGIFDDFNNPRAPFRVWFEYVIDKDYQPPMWATHYQVMYKPPKIDFQQRVIKSASFLSDGRIRLALDDMYTTTYQGATIQMQPQVGDSVRFIRKANNQVLQDPTTGDYVNYFGEYADNNGELVIYATGIGGDGALYIDVDNVGLDGIFRPNGNIINGNIPNGFIEIYRVSEATQNDPWLEIGETWPIIIPNEGDRYHSGDVSQLVGTRAARIYINGGDIYLRKRPQGTYVQSGSQPYFPQMCWVEDPAFSDYFVSDFNDKGRIGIEDVYAKEKQLKALVGHTSQYLDNTRVNRLNQVNFPNITYLREEQGPINRLIMNGFTLTCLQDRKNTSIYIQRAMSVNGTGDSNVILTDKTFGGTRPLEEDWGTMHGGSVIKADGYVYYYDYQNAAFVASTGGGQVDIAKSAKFSKGAYLLTKEMTPDNFVNAAVSKNFDEIHWYTVNDLGETITYVYNFKTKRWAFRMEHAMDFQGAMGRYHYTFKDGQVYLENSGDELTFFDEQQTQSVYFVFNLDPTTVKFYLNLWMQTNVKWNVPFISIPASLNASTGMLSHISAEQFKAQEGYLVAGYRKDESDPAFEYAQIAYVNGRRLCGYYILHRAEYTGTDKSFLLNAAVNYSVSRPINK